MFIALEIIVLAPILVPPFLPHVLKKQLHALPHYWWSPFAPLYLGAFMFLLLVSPFFLRSLRWVALLGWMIAFGILLFVLSLTSFAVLFPRF
jgi:hypothetical protein